MRPPWPHLALHSLVSGVPGVDSFGPPVASLLDVRGAGDRTGARGSLFRGHDGGVARSGKLLIQLHLVAFRCFPIPRTPVNYVSGLYTPRGRGDLSAFAGTTGGWPYCESLPVRFRSEGGQPLTHFDSFLVVIAGDGDGDARFPSARERRECVGMARSGELLIRLHFVAFASPEPHPPPSPTGKGDLQGCEVPAFVGTTSEIRQNDACEQCNNRRGYGAMGCCHCSEGGAWSDVHRSGRAVSHANEFVHCVVNGAG